MSGGGITHNSLNDGVYRSGGGVAVIGGASFNMTGGNISHNNAGPNGNGGGVHVDIGSSFYMSGGAVHHNSAYNNGGGVRILGGSFNMNGNARIHHNESLNATSGGAGGGVMVTQQLNNPGSFTMSGNASIDNNSSGFQGGGVRIAGNGTIFNMESGTITDNTAHMGGGLSIAVGSAVIKNGGLIANNTAQNGGGGVHVIAAGANAVFTMQNGAEIRGNSTGGNGGGVLVQNAVFNMEGGIIDNNQAINGGGLAIGSASTANITGGTITNNTASNSGGGLHATGGNAVLNMTGGEAQGNTALVGGGAQVQTNAAMAISGLAIIESNTATNGGGIATQTGGSLSIEDSARIANNSATDGGGVFVHSIGTTTSTANLSGGIIENNNATEGGGLHVFAAGTSIANVMISGAIITNNTASANGGGISSRIATLGNPNANLTILSGLIENNTAVGDGGGINISSGANLNMTAGSILGNTAVNGGGLNTPLANLGNISIGSAAVFNNNIATAGMFINNEVAEAYLSQILPGIVSMIWADNFPTGAAAAYQGHHAFTNYDINIHEGAMLVPVYFRVRSAEESGTIAAQGMSGFTTGSFARVGASVPFVATPSSNYVFERWYINDIESIESQLVITHIVEASQNLVEVYFETGATVTSTPSPTLSPSPAPAVLITPAPSPTSSPVIRAPQATASPAPTPETTLEPEEALENVSEEILGEIIMPAPPPWQNESHHAFLIGFSDDTIRPHAPISRAQVTTIFFRLMTDDDRESYWIQDNPFSDISINHWFNNAVSTIANYGLITGMPDGSFQPHRDITRAEFAVIIARVMGISYYGEAMFSDIDNHWARNEINAVARQGWITGYEGIGGRFRPNQSITRAEAVALVNRMLGRLPHSTDDLLEGMRIWPDNANPNAWFYLHIQEASNSHYYVRYENGIHEAWIELIQPERDWSLLERPYSSPNDIHQAINPMWQHAE